MTLTVANDAALPGLAAAADARRMTVRLTAALGTSVSVSAVEVVRHRPGTRAVLRYSVSAATGPCTFYGKVLAGGVDELAHTLASLHQAGLPHLPAPTLVATEIGLVVQPAVDGRALHEFVFDPGVPMGQRVKALFALGAATGVLHGLDVATPRRVTAADDVADLVRLTSDERRLDDAIDAVAAAAVRQPEGPVVPSHGGLRTDQALIVDGDAALLDFDGFCAARPARDLGNVLAYLHWRAVRRPADRAVVTAGRPALLEGYETTAPLPGEDALGIAEAASLVKIAGRRMRDQAAGEVELVPALLDAAMERLAGRDELGVLTDTATLAARIGRAVHGVEVVGHKPGRRAVLALRLDDGDAYAKAYSDRRAAARAWTTLQMLAPVVAVPQPLAFDADLGVVVCAAARGRGLHELAGSPSLLGGASAAGTWLRALHDAPVQLDRTFDADHEAADAERWAEIVIARLPGCAAGVAARAAALDARPAPVPLVPIHKDFQYEHVMVEGGVTVVDLDEARMGDPAFDLAHFLTYLDLLAFRSGASLGDRDRWADAFLSGYGRSVGPGRLRWYRDYTTLKIAKQLATGSGPQPGPRGATAEAEAAFILGGHR